MGESVYSFATRVQAEACFDEDWVADVTARYGKPEVIYFETPIVVDNEHKIVSE